jgi:hypothetical protein
MNSFFEYCTNTFQRHCEPKPVEKSPKRDPIFMCGNYACIQETKNPKDWIAAKFNSRYVYICSHECYNQWLDMPNYFGAWSPVQTVDQVHDPPSMKL